MPRKVPRSPDTGHVRSAPDERDRALAVKARALEEAERRVREEAEAALVDAIRRNREQAEAHEERAQALEAELERVRERTKARLVPLLRAAGARHEADRAWGAAHAREIESLLAAGRDPGAIALHFNRKRAKAAQAAHAAARAERPPRDGATPEEIWRAEHEAGPSRSTVYELIKKLSGRVPARIDAGASIQRDGQLNTNEGSSQPGARRTRPARHDGSRGVLQGARRRCHAPRR